jgi:hypothetical protein
LDKQEKGPDGGAREGAEKEDGGDGVGPHGMLGAEVVEAEEEGGEEDFSNPIHGGK